ncbi:MAG: hypothetical protein V1902_00215 [Candidatus Falkowbacteria bacterium]
MEQNYNDEMGLDKALGCKPSKNHRVLDRIAKIVGALMLAGIVLFLGLTALQLVRVYNLNEDSMELTQRVDEFTKCGEYESYNKCMDRAIARNPQKAKRMFASVQDLLDRRAEGFFWPANADYQGANGWPVTSLRVNREQLSASLDKWRTQPGNL